MRNLTFLRVFLITNIILTFFQINLATAQNPPPVQTYYVSLPEQEIKDYLTSLRDTGVCTSTQSDTVTTFFSFVVAVDNALVYIDHWEDTFETDLTTPVQSSTEIWGDGDISNGAAPGVTMDANDVLNRGDVVVVNNDVDVTTPLAIDYDGRDKIATTAPITFTRMGWGATHGTVLAGAVEQLPSISWGTDFEVPAGEDSGSTMYEYTAVSIMSATDGNVVSIDTDGDGAVDLTPTLNEGESYFVDGGLNEGATISGSAPLQAILVTGDICSSFASRWYFLTPDDKLSDHYYSPVSTKADDATEVILYNPNAGDITVFWEDSSGPVSSQLISGDSSFRVTLADGEGYHFFTADTSVFNALGSVDANDVTHDWGFTLIPENQLRQQAQVGMGFEWDPTFASTDDDASAIYLTATYPSGSASVGSIDVCVDFDGDRAGALSVIIDGVTIPYDQLITLNELEQAVVFDPDNDNTGTMFFICDGSDALVVTAWGQRPLTSGSGAPALDVGTTVPAFPDIVAVKKSALSNDINGDGFVDIGETITYEIRVDQAGNLPVGGCTLNIIDNLPAEVSYVPGTSEYDCDTVNNTECNCPLLGGTLVGTTCTISIPDDGAGTVFPFDDEATGNANCDMDVTPSNNWGNGVYQQIKLPIDGTLLYRFDTTITAVPPGNGPLVNTVNLSGLGQLQASDNLVVPGSLGDTIYIDLDGDGNYDTGEGINGVTLTIENDNGDIVGTTTTMNHPVGHPLAGEPGYYLFDGLPPDGYTIFIDATNFNPGNPLENSVNTIDPDGGSANEADFTINANQDIDTADFGFQQ